MSPPSLCSGDDKAGCGWKTDFEKTIPVHLTQDVNHQNTCNDSLINALQGLHVDGTLKVPTLDVSASNSLLDLSDGVGEDEWLLSASLAGSVDGAAFLDVDGKEWFRRHPSQEICDTDKKTLLVDMLDGLAEHSLGDGSVFISPQCNLSKNTSIQRMMTSHENSPMIPLPSQSLGQMMDVKPKPDASSFLEAHLHSPTLSDNPLSPSGILSLSPEEGTKLSSAANLTFDSLHSPPTKTGHSPPWPQLVSTPTAKPTNMAKSWQPAASRLGQLVPPEFAPKVELSPPESRCLNTTETKVTINVQDVDESPIVSPAPNALNTTQTMDTPMNTTHPMASSEANTTQTLGECPANTTQTLHDGPENTTQTLGEASSNTTQTYEDSQTNTTYEHGPVNTTQTYDEGPTNTTQTLEAAPADLTANVPHNTTETLETFENIESFNPECGTSTNTEERPPVAATKICTENCGLEEVSPASTSLTLATKHQDKSPTYETSEHKSNLISHLAEFNSSYDEVSTEVRRDHCNTTNFSNLGGSNIVMENNESNEDEQTQEKSNEVPKDGHTSPTNAEFVRNSSFTGTYRVSPMLDSRGKHLPGPGKKAGVKHPRAGGTIHSEEKPNVLLPKFPPKSKNVKPSLQRSASFRSSVPSAPASINLSTAKAAPKAKPHAVKSSAGAKQASDKFAKPKAETSSSSMRPRLSVQLKPSSVGLLSRASVKLNSAEKLNFTQMKPPSQAPPKLPTLPIQTQPSMMLPVRFQSRMTLPASVRAPAPNRPAPSGIRPPSARGAPSGIARLAGRHSMSASRLPLPGKSSS